MGVGCSAESEAFRLSLVSVVIPTRNRPKLVLRALHSVLAQTVKDIDVLVVVDGPDESTVDALRAVDDPRVRVVVNPKSLTAAGARNVGADHATGTWLAFLDDDDEWMPTRLERQLAFAEGRGPALITCLSRVVTPTATYVWPQDIYDNSIPIDDYLFDRRSPFMGASFIQTSSYLLPLALYQKVRFNVDSPHDDWDFLLRLCKGEGGRIETVPEVLVVIYAEERRASLTASTSWKGSLAWLESVRPLMTPRAYSGFCLGVVGSRAANERAYGAFLDLLKRAFRNGSPTPWHVATYLAFWLVPQDLRRWARSLVTRER